MEYKTCPRAHAELSCKLHCDPDTRQRPRQNPPAGSHTPSTRGLNAAALPTQTQAEHVRYSLGRSTAGQGLPARHCCHMAFTWLRARPRRPLMPRRTWAQLSSGQKWGTAGEAGRGEGCCSLPDPDAGCCSPFCGCCAGCCGRWGGCLGVDSNSDPRLSRFRFHEGVAVLLAGGVP